MSDSGVDESGANSLIRLIDANINRLKEGLRVLEDISRYVHSNRDLSYRLKELRHMAQKGYDIKMLEKRDARGDILKKSTSSEMKRRGLEDLIIANFSRAQESSRVLEEAFKLLDTTLSEHYKNIRYELYDLEKHLLNP